MHSDSRRPLLCRPGMRLSKRHRHSCKRRGSWFISFLPQAPVAGTQFNVKDSFPGHDQFLRLGRRIGSPAAVTSCHNLGPTRSSTALTDLHPTYAASLVYYAHARSSESVIGRTPPARCSDGFRDVGFLFETRLRETSRRRLVRNQASRHHFASLTMAAWHLL